MKNIKINISNIDKEEYGTTVALVSTILNHLDVFPKLFCVASVLILHNPITVNIHFKIITILLFTSYISMINR